MYARHVNVPKRHGSWAGIHEQKLEQETTEGKHMSKNCQPISAGLQRCMSHKRQIARYTSNKWQLASHLHLHAPLICTWNGSSRGLFQPIPSTPPISALRPASCGRGHDKGGMHDKRPELVSSTRCSMQPTTSGVQSRRGCSI